MNTPQANRTQICCNVMEFVVTQEIERQLHYWPPQLVQYINKVEVMTYAMNRLPALYASSEEGLRYQLSRATRELTKQITEAVRQGLAAVLGDPLRSAVPLQPHEDMACQAALQKLRELLQDEHLSWNSLPDAVERTLLQAAEGKVSWKPRHYSVPCAVSWDEEF